MDAKLIKDMIGSSINNSEIKIIDLNDMGDHFSVLVVSDDFKDMNLIKRPQLVYSLLKEYITKEIHALQLKTLTIKEYEEK